MNKKYFNVPVSLKDNNARIVEGVIQYDTADLFNIKLYDGTEAFDFTGYTMVVLTVIKPDGNEYIDKDGETLDIVSPEDGRMALTLPETLTAQVGMHFCEVVVYANGIRLASARFNYYVQKSLTDGSGMQSESEYPLVQKLLAQLSLIADAEQMRTEAEYLRMIAENGRESVTSGIVEQTTILANRAMSYAKAAEDWYNLLINYAGETTGVNLSGIATKQELTEAVSNMDCGLFDGSVYKAIQILRGELGNMPSLRDGEFGYVKDAGQLYIGDNGTNVLLNGSCFIAQATAPADTSRLWIDTGNANAIKFFDGEKWASTSTATFG
jgi:hypothetical protein